MSCLRVSCRAGGHGYSPAAAHLCLRRELLAGSWQLQTRPMSAGHSTDICLIKGFSEQVATEIALLLRTFALGGSFSQDSGGGGRHSNMRLLLALLPLGALHARTCSAAELQVLTG